MNAYILEVESYPIVAYIEEKQAAGLVHSAKKGAFYLPGHGWASDNDYGGIQLQLYTHFGAYIGVVHPEILRFCREKKWNFRLTVEREGGPVREWIPTESDRLFGFLAAEVVQLNLYLGPHSLEYLRLGVPS